ncbi:uncharacterized protein DUF1127 [Roseiarcus fermentans]|uniref:Uncharacterized protein DUF1127 n=1 Tax=Roseiarcus fermentans TaxID=1473586 RepID=A0A366FUF4_9HYPH|nr:DUF1127 domain-containing protein [Roseiarcus fermentans]RBP18303.1 uncharacterized protein DUF1127 [Roseiarcus fermentans]
MSPLNRVWSRFSELAARAAAWPFRVAAARATMRALAGMDRRELMDIGLTVSDVRDASALPLDRDPTALLARRARERRRDAFAPPTAPEPPRELGGPRPARADGPASPARPRPFPDGRALRTG